MEEANQLKLYNVQYEDEGPYLCVAGNFYGMSWEGAYLDVVERTLQSIVQEAFRPLIDFLWAYLYRLRL